MFTTNLNWFSGRISGNPINSYGRKGRAVLPMLSPPGGCDLGDGRTEGWPTSGFRQRTGNLLVFMLFDWKKIVKTWRSFLIAPKVYVVAQNFLGIEINFWEVGKVSGCCFWVLGSLKMESRRAAKILRCIYMCDRVDQLPWHFHMIGDKLINPIP